MGPGGSLNQIKITEVFIFCSSTIESIGRKMQDLVEKINESRTSDQIVMDHYQEKFVGKVLKFSKHLSSSRLNKHSSKLSS